ncbi:unnamed protein product [Closterium sp. NIES-54]
MAAQELRWLTYLLTDLGEQPRSPPVLYIDNKAMLALCREHRLEHRTKHIALCYFLARELQQRGQLRLAYVASEANTADIFSKALAPGDHQRFCTMLGFPTSHVVECALVSMGGLVMLQPSTNSQNELLFLAELEKILELTQAPEFEMVMTPLFQQIARCLSSSDFEVAERTLRLWDNDHIVTLTVQNRATILPLIFAALERNARRCKEEILV